MITEYMPSAPGDAVKVYLYGLFLCFNTKLDQPFEEVAKSLNMTEKEVLDSLSFWEEFGLISVNSTSPLSIEYFPIKASGLTKPIKYKAEKYTDFSKALQTLLPLRMIPTNEYQEYYSIMEIYKIKQDAMLLIVKYCADLKGEDIGLHYISKVAKDFGKRGLITVDKVEKELSSYLLKTGEIAKILKALSLKRQPDIEDQNYFTVWTKELDFEPENIIFVASKIKKGGMQKLNEFLLELYSKKCFSKEEISAYLDEKKGIYELAIKINKALSIYVEVLDPVIDTYVNKWLSYGYQQDALLLIASICFKSGKNSLQAMDELVEKLRSQGVIDLVSVGDYFENDKKVETLLSQILLTAGVNRRPTKWDKNNLEVWKSWNFSDEMIIEAAKLSAGKSSPMAYVNGVLSNWKNKGIFDTQNIENSQDADSKTVSIERYNLEYKNRRALALSTAGQNTEKAMELEGFSSIYERLFTIEKDLAFAEINGNTESLIALEKEQKEITIKVQKMLKTIGLTLNDLSPKYMCDKCNDTGYVGTNRCDCFDKFLDKN